MRTSAFQDNQLDALNLLTEKPTARKVRGLPRVFNRLHHLLYSIQRGESPLSDDLTLYHEESKNGFLLAMEGTLTHTHNEIL